MKGESILESYANIIKSKAYLDRSIHSVSRKRDLLSCDYDIDLKGLLSALNESGCGFICVTKTGIPYGIVTDGDVRRAVMNKVKIEKDDIINTNFLKINEKDSVRMAIRKMSVHKSFVKMIPVEGSALSFVSTKSIIMRF
jgi:predicted transcriptional regulator